LVCHLRGLPGEREQERALLDRFHVMALHHDRDDAPISLTQQRACGEITLAPRLGERGRERLDQRGPL
jgi:hypothetical protein